MTERHLRESIGVLATIVALSVESCDARPLGETGQADELRERFRDAARTWSAEHPDFPPQVHVLVRRVISEAVRRDP